MHATLTIPGNVKLIVLWFAVLAICIGVGIGSWWLAVVLFSLAGLVAGFLQGHAVRKQPSVFQTAASALAVRKALLSSPFGLASVLLLWLSAAALLAMLFLARPPISLSVFIAALPHSHSGGRARLCPPYCGWQESPPVRRKVAPNPSIERTVSSGLRPLPTAAHVKR